MASINKVNPITMSEEIGKRRDSLKKFVTDWEEVNGRTQRTTVFRTYSDKVHDNGSEMAKLATTDFVDEEVTEYLNKT